MARMRKNLNVGEIMTANIITCDLNDSIVSVAKKMAEHKIGFIVVVSNGKPVGVMSEGDLIREVLSKELDPKKVKAKQIYKSPVITISPNKSLLDASKLMAKNNIRRLIVMDKGKMVGVISSRDILQYAPYLIEILTERLHAERGEELIASYESQLVGICEVCGKWSDSLKLKNGLFVCEECYLSPSQTS